MIPDQLARPNAAEFSDRAVLTTIGFFGEELKAPGGLEAPSMAQAFVQALLQMRLAVFTEAKAHARRGRRLDLLPELLAEALLTALGHVPGGSGCDSPSGAGSDAAARTE